MPLTGGEAADVELPPPVLVAVADAADAFTLEGASAHGMVVAVCVTVNWPSVPVAVMVVDWM